MIHQPYIRYKHYFRPLTLEELEVGLKYIHITPWLTPKELKETNFHIFEIRAQMKEEPFFKYEEYKKDIKKWTANGELYSIKNPSLKRDAQSSPSLELFNQK